MIAHLEMYDRPETAAANDRFWASIRDHLGGGPGQLTRGADFWEVWKSPDLLLSQTCGCPYRTRLYGEVELVGTPDYGLPGCPPGHYNSVFVARKEDAGQPLGSFAGRRFAYNEALSQSGWAAPMVHLHDRSILPGALVDTGGHRLSAEAVAEGRADFAALDALTWEMVREFDGFAAGLTEIERTEPTPGLPYITALGGDTKALFSAIESAIRGLDPETRRLLHLNGLVQIAPSGYLAVPTPPGPVLTSQRIRTAELT
ncbi:phosphate/phosphite/phosphonate ABC transporter substrate-binding protein [Leisingera aquaemixtae]|uniref:Phosphate/phosphite/phosphonate ABC transporters, periplasmic binding protein n=1 Tax=Leisingera aquaemixtae TaxID=1396826 RepID=A0A0P1HZ70_9RHOB|nr:PhnD/SsuA/transferrin family substrate-binding protein [Leisingera aquaemixtae]CUI01827.1 phosphate/phosphite/phosphonate ABC transporters, periplasmic binding protein [Leisingera aquaemixtae]